MRRCIALVHSRVHGTVWHPCRRAAMRGDHFCAAHRDGLDGAYMGLLNTVTFPDGKKGKHKRAGRARKRKRTKWGAARRAWREKSAQASAIGALFDAALASGHLGSKIPGTNFRTSSCATNSNEDDRTSVRITPEEVPRKAPTKSSQTGAVKVPQTSHGGA